MADRLFDRPMRRDPVVRLWSGAMALVAVLAVPQYVDWGEPYDPERAWQLFGLLLGVALLLWLLLFVPAVLRWSRRRARARSSTSSWTASTGWSGGSGVPFGPVPTHPVRPAPPPSAATATVPPVGVPTVPVPSAEAAWTTSGPEAATTHLVPDLLREAPAPPRVHLDLRPLGELKMLTVAGRTVRQGEAIRLDWDFSDAERVLVDGVPQSGTRGGCYWPVSASRDVLVQAFQGDRLLHSVRVPVVVVEEEPEPEPFDWFGPPAVALERVVSEREERRREGERSRARTAQHDAARAESRAQAEHDAAVRAPRSSTTSTRRGLRRARRRAQETSDA